MAPLSPSLPETGLSSASKPERGKMVIQPMRMREIKDQLALLETIENLGNKVSERSGEDRSGDWSGAGAGRGAQGDDGKRVSPRDRAILAMPQEAPVLRAKLATHIHREIHDLHRLSKAAARSHRAGSAYRLNELYARIRRLNALLVEILDASVDFLKRLFIRVFIDNQPVL